MTSPAAYSAAMASLLLVEDDDVIGKVLKSVLGREGHHVTWVRDGHAALAIEGPWDLVLLDLTLPDLDGVEVCRRVRSRYPESVIVMLTARREELDVIIGLEAGADDYLTKPFRYAELGARIRAHLRRATPAGPDSAPVWEAGQLVVDVGTRRCLLAGVEIALRAREFDLLARLASEPGQAVSRETLINDVWDENWFGSTKTLDVHIAAVRRRLADAARAAGIVPPEITTLRGHGYRLER